MVSWRGAGAVPTAIDLGSHLIPRPAGEGDQLIPLDNVLTQADVPSKEPGRQVALEDIELLKRQLHRHAFANTGRPTNP